VKERIKIEMKKTADVHVLHTSLRASFD